MAILDGLIGCWSPSLGASGYRLLDRTQYGNHGTLTNMDAGTDWVASPVGVVLDFDGTNDFVLIGSPQSISGALPRMSKTLWVNVRQTASQKYLFADFNGAGTISRMSISHDTKFKAFQNTATALTGTTTLSTGVWYFVAVTRNDGTGAGGTGSMKLYVNGMMEASTTYSYTSPSLQASGEQIARSNAAFGDYPNAQIGEATIWRRDLTDAEIVQLFKSGNGWIGRELGGMNRRRRAVKGPSFRAAWALRQRQILGGGGGLG